MRRRFLWGGRGVHFIFLVPVFSKWIASVTVLCEDKTVIIWDF